jgi:hypothetical protein
MSTEYRFLGTVCLHQFLEAVDADDVAGEDVDVALVAALDVVEDVGEQANQERVVLRDQGVARVRSTRRRRRSDTSLPSLRRRGRRSCQLPG